jgi:hypothetical protein
VLFYRRHRLSAVTPFFIRYRSDEALSAAADNS